MLNIEREYAAARLGVVDVLPIAETGLLALVGGVLLTVGTRKERRLHVAGVVSV